LTLCNLLTIVSTAFIADDGEYAWQREHIFAALRTIAETGQAILGGDVWTVENGEVCSIFPNTRGIRMWNTESQKPDELWADYCQRTLKESINEIEKTQLENNVSQELQKHIFFNPTYIEKSDIKSLIPRDKHDLERAEAAIKIGYPAVAPILPELLEWLQDLNWPVAQILAPFLATIGKPLIPHIQHIFASDDEIWKYWIMTYIIADSAELAEAFRNDLERIAYSPTEREVEEELNETAQHILNRWVKPVA